MFQFYLKQHYQPQGGKAYLVYSSCGGNVIYFGGGTGEGACSSRVTGSRTWAGSEAEPRTLRPALSDPFPLSRFHLLTDRSLPKLHHQQETICSNTRAYQKQVLKGVERLSGIIKGWKVGILFSLAFVQVFAGCILHSHSACSLLVKLPLPNPSKTSATHHLV